MAAKNNNIPLVEQLLEQSAKEARDESSADIHDFQGVTPLMIALERGHIKVAETILDKRVGRSKKDIMKATDNDKNNVFHYALVSSKCKEATHLLVDQCPSADSLKKYLTAKNIDEDTPFHLLAKQKNKETPGVNSLRNLLKAEKSTLSDEILKTAKSTLTNKDILTCVAERNLKEETPLHTAARCGNKTFVDSILEIGEDELLQMERLLAETDKERNTVFHLAAKKNQEYVKADIDGTAGSNVLKSLIYFLKDTQQIEPAKVLSFKNDKEDTFK